MMHRRGGKRIRMDDPPPEYENPMTPMTPYSPYSTPYHNSAAATPLHTGNDLYSENYGGHAPQEDDYSHHHQQHQQLYQTPEQQHHQQQAEYQAELERQQQLQQQQQMQQMQPQQQLQQQQLQPQDQLQQQQQMQQMQQLQQHQEQMQHQEQLQRQEQMQQHQEELQQQLQQQLQVQQEHEPLHQQPTQDIEQQHEDEPRGRVTRSRVRGAMNAPPPPSSVPNPTAAQIRKALADDTNKQPKKRAATGRKSNNETLSEDEASLYFILKNGRASIQTTVDDWIETYKAQRDVALLSLMQFFINASGCKGKITSAMQVNMEHAGIIRKMTEEFDEESGEYPLIMAGQQWKKFKNNFCDFVQTLVRQCQYSIIYDQYLMDNVISLLTGLSDSQVRAFRHTATLAAMKLMTALVDVALTVSVTLANTQRQYEAERQKTRDKRAADRLESLMAKRQELEENMDEIKNMLTYMFKSVFVHRYRDTLPDIRAICMAEIGVWMKKFHSNFLDDSYLKYIGWTLHDKVGEVRLKCLQALQPLYSSEELKGKLELFTSKFKDRIVAMTLDKEYDVAVQAVRLVISILKHHRDILTDKDCEHVYELVYSSHRQVAQAAGEFLNERLFVLDENAVAGIKTRRGKKRLPNTPLIRDLVQFFIESELHEHGAYLVDSLIESNDMMKDWECMTDLLLEEPGPHEEPLDDRQETSLIEIMVCCIRQSATGEPPVGRGPTRKQVPSVKEVKQVKEDRERLTDHFVQTLPPLLEKYGVDSDKLTNLLTIPQHFDLERYTSSRQEGNLDQLLKKIQKIVDRSTDNDVLDSCAKTLEILCSEGTAIYTRCDVARSTLIDTLVNKYKEAMDEWRSLIEGEEEPNEEETFQVITSLKKVSIFSACHNLGQWGIWGSIFQDVNDAKEKTHKTLPEEAIKYCISACYYGILWDLKNIEDRLEAGGTADGEINSLNDRLHQFIDLIKEILQHTDVQSFREEAYITLCDLLVTFSSQLAQGTHAALEQLVFDADKSVCSMLNGFIQTYVFIDEDEEELDEHSKIEELHKRRNFLASFCKLIVYNMMPIQVAGDVFKHYVKYYNDYGDIIKATLGKAREINKVNCARTMVSSLTVIFKELQTDGQKVNRAAEEFTSVKELAKRFALSFGLDAVKNREAITALHREGILFAVFQSPDAPEDPSNPPPNLAFLEILSEFTNKLLKQDKRVVLSFLNKRISAGMPSSRGEDWQPLLQYRNSLVHGESDQPIVTSKRAYGRKKKDAADDEEGDENANSDEEYNAGY